MNKKPKKKLRYKKVKNLRDLINNLKVTQKILKTNKTKHTLAKCVYRYWLYLY